MNTGVHISFGISVLFSELYVKRVKCVVCKLYFVKVDLKIESHCFSFGEGNGNPLQCSCLKNPRDRGA